MIIPPDPEKDPRLFDESASTPTPSLLPPPTESDGDSGDIGARSNPAFGYPYHAATRQINDADQIHSGAVDPFSDEVALGVDGQYSDETLPPYSRRRSRDMRSPAALGADVEQAGIGGATSPYSSNPVYPHSNSHYPSTPTPSNVFPEMRERERERDPRTRSPPSQPSHVIVPINTSNLLGMGNGIAPSPMSAGTDLDTPTTPSARLSMSAQTDADAPGSSSAHLAGSTLVSHAGHGSGRGGEGGGSARGKVWEGSAFASGSGSGSGLGSGAGAGAAGKGKGKARSMGLLRKMKLLPTPTSNSTPAGPSTSTRLARGSSSIAALPIPIPSTSTLPTPTSFSDSEKPSSPALPQVWWTKYKRWIIAALVLALIVIGALIGLVVGFKQQGTTEEAEAARARAFAQANGPAWHDLDPGDRGLGGMDGSMNLTWVDGRVSVGLYFGVGWAFGSVANRQRKGRRP